MESPPTERYQPESASLRENLPEGTERLHNIKPAQRRFWKPEGYYVSGPGQPSHPQQAVLIFQRQAAVAQRAKVQVTQGGVSFGEVLTRRDAPQPAHCLQFPEVIAHGVSAIRSRDHRFAAGGCTVFVSDQRWRSVAAGVASLLPVLAWLRPIGITDGSLICHRGSPSRGGLQMRSAHWRSVSIPDGKDWFCAALAARLGMARRTLGGKPSRDCGGHASARRPPRKVRPVCQVRGQSAESLPVCPDARLSPGMGILRKGSRFTLRTSARNKECTATWQ